MRLSDILTVTNAECFSPEVDLDREVTCAFASDLMSDVLRYDMSQGLLVTGLVNPQVARTAEMAIPILGTRLIMFEACGRLYEAGLRASRPHNGHS
jgi:hypothetical protein